MGAVSETHLTLPTICSVEIGVGAVSFKTQTMKRNFDVQLYVDDHTVQTEIHIVLCYDTKTTANIRRC